MYKSRLSKASTLLVWFGFWLTLSISSNYFIGCRVPLGCQVLMQAPEEWVFGIPIAYYGVFSYLLLIFCLGLKIWGSSKQRSLGIQAGFYISGVSAFINFCLLNKLWVDDKPLCVACVCSAIVYLVLTFFHLRLIGRLSRYQFDINESYVFFMGAMCAIGGYTVQHIRLTHKTKFITPLAYEEIVPEFQRVRGKVNSKVKIIAYTDLFCWQCRQSYKELQKIYKSSSENLSYGIRYFPSKEPLKQSLSMQWSLLSLCIAEKGKYWEFLNHIMDQKQENIDEPHEVIKLVKKYGIQKHEYINAIQSPRLNQVIKKDLFFAKSLNIQSVPMYFIYIDDHPLYIATAYNLKKVLSEKPFKEWIKIE